MSAYYDGRRARYAGKRRGDNPYQYPGHHGQWNRGWEDADYDMKKGQKK